MIEKINAVIGKAYDKDNYNCWDLVMELNPKAPSFDEVGTLYNALKYMNKDNYNGFKITDAPQDGCICLLGKKPNVFHHAGIYFQGLIVHAVDPTVVANEISVIKKLYPYMRFYSCR